MKESNGKKYKQLAIFSTIVAEMVLTPSLLGGGTYFLLQQHPYRVILSGLGIFIGFGIAIYRVYRLNEAFRKK